MKTQLRVAAALLCGTMALGLAGCTSAPEAEVMDSTVLVETTVAQRDTLQTDSTYIGTISAEGTASVVATVSGNVEQVAVSVGDFVSAGELLCRFEDESAQLNLNNAQASYSSAQASYSSAQASYNSVQETYRSTAANFGGDDLTLLTEQVRLAQENYDAQKELLELGAVSSVEVEQAYQSLLSAQASKEAAQANLDAVSANVQSAQSGLESARAGIQSAQVGVESAQYQLSLYRITTPISGVVEAVNVLENHFTSSGTVAFVISNAQNKSVTFYVTDEVRQNLSVGQEVSVSVRNLTYSGVVSEISGVVDAATGLFQCKALIDGAQDLPDGLSVSVTTASSVVQNAIIVPSDALYFDNGVAYVYRMQDGKAVRTEVEEALYTRQSTAVSSGLSEGDVIITSWSAMLKDGVPVRVYEQDS
jgi:multidrug resistance efflux pump